MSTNTALADPTRKPTPSSAPHSGGSAELELTILMPCLNEAETLGTCIDKGHAFLRARNITGEILVADNGSTDGSLEIAAEHGARLVNAPVRGYGAALRYGIENARGRYVIIGDSDDSYDFSQLGPFVDQLRAGFDLVMGNRFSGGIAPGSMPFLHRYLGNPVLSFLGRLFFSSNIGDFHCGLRGFRRDAVLGIGLMTSGMEFASELVVRATLAGLLIAEVPTTLSRDGRSRPSHLRTWRDGWRHLRFLLLFSPRWLFLYPGAFILVVGLALSLALLPGPVRILPHVTLDVHSLIVACIATIVGLQCVSFAVVARKYAASRGILPPSERLDRFKGLVTVERVLILACALFLGGLLGVAYSILYWAKADFGPLQYGSMVRVLTVSCTFIAIALQLGFTTFLSAVFDIDLS